MTSMTRLSLLTIGLAASSLVSVTSAKHVVKPNSPEARAQDMGATFYNLEGKTGRLTTKFKSGHYAVSHRAMTGEVDTVVFDIAGNEKKHHHGGRTMHESTKYAHNEDITSLVTEWEDGVIATLTSETFPMRKLKDSRTLGGPAWVSDVTQNGVPVMHGIWYKNSQIYTYKMPSHTGTGVIAPDMFAEHYGNAWGFEITPAWVNLQTINLFQSKQVNPFRIAEAGCSTLVPTVISRVLDFFVPSVHANDYGCDYLHYLDGTIIQNCCDNHDRCYEKRSPDACNIKSWWRWGSWTCDWCNIQAVFCFAVLEEVACPAWNTKLCGY